MKRLIAALLISFSLLSRSFAGEINMHRTLARVGPERLGVYENVIVPWLQDEFSSGRLVYPGGATAKRALLRTDLMRFEIIDGQDRYSIHIEYTVRIRDASGLEETGVKGQEIIFWLEDEKIMDFLPFDEYWIKAEVSGSGARPGSLLETMLFNNGQKPGDA